MEDIEDIRKRGEFDGVGESIGEKIAECLGAEELDYDKELEAGLPIEIEAITSVEGGRPEDGENTPRGTRRPDV